MARKEEIKIVHPRQALAALAAYNEDVSVLMAASRNAIRFINDDTIDAEKVRRAIVPVIQSAVDRVARWYDAD